MKLLVKLTSLSLLITYHLSAQIINSETLAPFKTKLNENKQVTQILLLGDSHIQADWLSGFLRQKFQEKYGNAGRGLVFPYAVANSNGPEDLVSTSDQTWENFRLVYEQDIFPQMGASGFVIGNYKNSFLEIVFKNPSDSFDKVLIFHDEKMNGENLRIYDTNSSLKNFAQRKTERISYQIQDGETYPELASKFYTTTTKLSLLNGNSIRNPKVGTRIKTDKISIVFNPNFIQNINLLSEKNFINDKTWIEYSSPKNTFLIQSNSTKGNIFYGFQFLKNAKNGVVFNIVGVNGATYGDFLKYPLQIQQLKSLNPDIVMIALGTNESLSSINKTEFKENAKKLITTWRQEKPNLPILLISPTDNRAKSQKAKEIASWIKEIAEENNTAFLDLHQKTGGIGYFQKALNRKEANPDGIHFLKTGYEKQAQIIWTELMK